MKWILRIILCIPVLIGLAVGATYATGNGAIITFTAKLLLNRPGEPFNPKDAVAALDYATPTSWAALPNKDDLADMSPAGTLDLITQGSAPVDVFFIHPTGFLKGSSWIDTMAPGTVTEENTRWSLVNQASIFNGCCNVYAPRYRQASIFAFFESPEDRDEILAFAYQDIEESFQYYLDNYNQGRPFIIASHSQGTMHGFRLLKDVIDNTPLAEQLVTAYIVGAQIKTAQIDELQSISACSHASDLSCVVTWDTFSETVIDKEFPTFEGNICVNPLSWELDGGLVTAEQHVGGVPASGEFQFSLSGSNAATGVEFEPLAAPVTHLVSAQCKNGILFISDQSDTAFKKIAVGFLEGSYHILDLSMFHLDIRENVKVRIAAYFDEHEKLKVSLAN